MTTAILTENARRLSAMHATWDPITGLGSIMPRKKVVIPDFPVTIQYLPETMLEVPLVKKILRAKSIGTFLSKTLKTDDTQANRQHVIRQFIRIRCRHDFPFWAAVYVYIKNKGGGGDVRFTLNQPQRKLITAFEQQRIAGKPIRVVLLKARQWGGSTATQIYMAWLQLIHQEGLNSLIVAHVKDTSIAIRDMFDRMLAAYPAEMLHAIGESYDSAEPKMVGVGNSINTKRIPQRNCVIKIGSAETPDSARGGDYNLVHCSEVGLWKTTDGKTPEDIVRSACSGILLRPYTMIVYESTANGTGNFFQREWDAAKRGQSQFSPVFVSWYEIEQYTADIDDPQAFADWLYQNRDSDNVASERVEPGKYLWWLWEQGATLQAINWYIQERSKYNDHGDMASEYPSDDIEAFTHSGARVFDRYKVNALAGTCRPPRYIGEVTAEGDNGEDALRGLKFADDKQGLLWVWQLPDIDPDEMVTDRYLTVVDIGGRSRKADWSVIVVFDRIYMMDGDKPGVVAQWYGHIDMDLLAWKAAQIAAFYDNSLLVIESNTLETHDRDRSVDGDQSSYILAQIRDVYPNLYARRQSEDDIRNGVPRKYGFHTNVATKPMIISTLVKSIREQLYVERDQRCLDQYLTYEQRQNGSYGAIPGKHDDLLMTRAIGLHVCFHEMEIPQVRRRSQVTPTQRKVISEATI